MAQHGFEDPVPGAQGDIGTARTVTGASHLATCLTPCFQCNH